MLCDDPFRPGARVRPVRRRWRIGRIGRIGQVRRQLPQESEKTLFDGDAVGAVQPLPHAHLWDDVGDDLPANESRHLIDQALIEGAFANHVNGSVGVYRERGGAKGRGDALGQKAHRRRIGGLDGSNIDWSAAPGQRKSSLRLCFVEQAGLEGDGIEGATLNQLLLDDGLQ